MKAFFVMGAVVVILTACTPGDVRRVSSSVSLAESCQDEGYEAGTAEFRECQETLADAELIRARVRELRGNRR